MFLRISAVEQIEALPVDYCLDVMMFLIKLKLQETELYEYVCHKLESEFSFNYFELHIFEIRRKFC